MIVGAGKVGRALGGAWRKAGHSVTMAQREPGGGKAGELRQQGYNVVAMNEAALAGDVIVLAPPAATRPSPRRL